VSSDLRKHGDFLRALSAFAKAGGARGDWVDAGVEAVLSALLDPGRRETLDKARRVLKAKQAGATIPQLCERFGHKRAHIYRLIAVVSSHRRQVRDVILSSTANSLPNGK
jgi:hypothetical protein